MENNNVIKKEIPIPELLQKDPAIPAVLMADGVEYIGCPASKDETLEQVALRFRLDVDDLVTKVNEYLKRKNEENS
ncbi:MAG: DUF1858 domain-containing protein [Eubacterium sp.]|nr:DUF1858 domain-containing protein [Eubacterium sp.]